MARIAYPECGRIINTRGLNGCVKVEPWCDTPHVFASLPAVYVKEGDVMRAIRVRSASVSGNVVFAQLEGVNTIEAADAMRGTLLYARREDLRIPEGAMLVAEMIGLPVYHVESGEQLGTLADVIHPAATEIYVIDTPKGSAMVPVVAEFVKRADETGIYLLPIEGMFEV